MQLLRGQGGSQPANPTPEFFHSRVGAGQGGSVGAGEVAGAPCRGVEPAAAPTAGSSGQVRGHLSLSAAATQTLGIPGIAFISQKGFQLPGTEEAKGPERLLGSPGWEWEAALSLQPRPGAWPT